MRWLLFLVLATLVWFLVHASSAARVLFAMERGARPPGTSTRFSPMPGMLVMPLVSMAAAALADAAAPWGFRAVVYLHVVGGAWLLGYVALAIVRARRGASPSAPGSAGRDA